MIQLKNCFYEFKRVIDKFVGLRGILSCTTFVDERIFSVTFSDLEV